ncbi:MAG TPA: hypothetical protein VK689_07150 [Armatimonadota bacterium]|nr:hypothetical protein [Armatimonadota bacterium]
MDIKIGSPVWAEDGEAGRVERLILHPETHELEALVAVQGGLLGRDVVIPVDRLLAADDDGVRVRGTAEEIDNLEPFAQSQYTAPPEEWIPPTSAADAATGFYLFPQSPLMVGAFVPPATQSAPEQREVQDLAPGDVEVSGHTPVYCEGGSVGHLERVLTESGSDHLTHVVIKLGVLMGRAVAVPMADVASMDDDGIRLNLTEAELGALPAYEDA